MMGKFGRGPGRLGAGLAAAAFAVLVVTPTAAAAPRQEDPPVTLPPPPVTVQQVINELLPLIRQLDPLTQQVGPVLAQLDGLFVAGGEFATQFAALGQQLDPILSTAGTPIGSLGAALEPLFVTIDEQVSPQLQDLLALLGPYVNQVDLATAFQLIGPLAPSALKVIPTLNKFYDGVDAITGPVTYPITCPLARAVPQQKLLDIVVPFLCYDTLAAVGQISDGAPADPLPPADMPPSDSVEVPGNDPVADPVDPLTDPVVDPSALTSGGSSLDALPPLASTPTASSNSVPRASGTAAEPLATLNASDAQVEALEDRMRLMAILAVAIGALLWSAFRAPADDGRGGLGAFRKSRAEPPPTLS